MEPTSTCVVVTGGGPVDPSVLDRIPDAALVIGVDSGVAHAIDLGLHVDVAVGDFDSLAPDVLAAVVRTGARVERHPTAKDATDLELGLVAAARSGATRVVVVGGHGGRLDHLLANALLLASPRFAGLAVEALLGPAWVAVARPGGATAIAGRPGDVVSLLPVGGAATGVVTTGLAYPLAGEELTAGTTRGISNELTCGRATVSLGCGTLLVVRPGRAAR
jgi:thiamine pyrophosphokinase